MHFIFLHEKININKKKSNFYIMDFYITDFFITCEFEIYPFDKFFH